MAAPLALDRVVVELLPKPFVWKKHSSYLREILF